MRSVKLAGSLAVALFLWTVPAGFADVLKFPGTPVKQVTLEGAWSQAKDFRAIDPAKGTQYQSHNSSDEMSVATLDATIPGATRQLFSLPPGALSQQQIAALGSRENPWILRYVAERGQPQLQQVGKRKLLTNAFAQEMRVRTARSADSGSVCLPATKYEAHAFLLDGNKLVHISLIRSMRDSPMEGFEKSWAKQFQTVLAKIAWN